MKNSLAGSVVAITGAGSGIGKSLAFECINRGASVALSDINIESLQGVKQEIESQYSYANVLIQSLDVADKAAVEQWAKVVVDYFGQVNVIINNAGVALSVSAESMAQKDFEWLMNINFWGVVHGCKAFLPLIKKSSWGHIINVSSLFGLISTPNNSAYNAAKFAVRGFTESLRIELMMTEKHVGVSCVHPGGIKTNIANSSRYGGSQIGVAARMNDKERKQNFNEEMARTTPEKAAKIIINGMIKKRPRILVGADAKLLDLVQRILPAKYQHIVARVFR